MIVPANMEEFELTNEQREFFGLDPIVDTWERVVFAGDTYRPESVLYFDGLTIKRHIVTNTLRNTLTNSRVTGAC